MEMTKMSIDKEVEEITGRLRSQFRAVADELAKCKAELKAVKKICDSKEIENAEKIDAIRRILEDEERN